MSWPQPPQDPRFRIGINQRLTTGKLLRLRNPQEIANGLSDLPTLSEGGYSEIEIAGLQGHPRAYILARTILDFPQVFVGYAEDGLAILLGVTEVLKGHATILGKTGSGKTTFIALIVYQLARLGYCCLLLGNKIFDPTLYASARAACEAPTRRDEKGNPETAPFRFVTLGPGFKTSGVNYIEHIDRDNGSRMLKASNLLDALSLSAEQDEPARQYFWGQALRLIEETPWTKSFENIDSTIEEMRLDRDRAYSTSGVRDAIRAVASLPMLNLEQEDPATIDLQWLIRKRGAVYIEAAGVQVGNLAASANGLMLQAFVAAKLREDPLNKQTAFVIIDEAQKFARGLLRNAIDQCRAARIFILFLAQTAEQFGDDYPILAQTQVTVYFSALAGSTTERYLGASFGTRTAYDLTFGDNVSSNGNSSISESSDGSVTISSGEGHQKGSNFGLTERRDVPNWNSGDTKGLNDNPLAFVIVVNPRQEFVKLDSGGNRASCVGPPMFFEEINRVALKVHEDSPHTFIPETRPEKPKPKQIAHSTEREVLLKKLQRAAGKIRNAV